jgi:drug/metabolite transporter (DMT)-like permease
MAFIRALFRLIPLFILLLRTKEIKAVLSMQQPMAHLWRILAYISFTYCLLYALSKSSLTTTITLQYITPFFVLLLSAWILKEKISKQKWIAVGVATIGILIALRPTVNFEMISLLIIAASLFGSLNKVLIRQLTATESSISITIYGNLAMVLFSIPIVVMEWQPLVWKDLFYFLIAGIFTATAQYTSVQALRFAQASSLAPLDGTSLIWCALFDYCIWQKLPHICLLIGVGIIIASNVYLLGSKQHKLRNG